MQDKKAMNLYAGAVAEREVAMARGHGRANRLVHLDRRMVGVIDAQPAGTP